MERHMEMLNEIIALGVGGVVTGAIILVFQKIKISASLPRRVERIEAGVIVLLNINEIQIDSMQVSLIAVRDGCANGAISDALEKLEGAKKLSRDYFISQAIGRK
jgi:hypothetical protein